MRSASRKVVVVGGGPAAGECVAALRMTGFAGSIDLISADPQLPYLLPALSKAYLQGKAGVDDVLLRPATTYSAHDINVRCGVRAERIDRSSRQVVLSDGGSVAYDRLVLATGARPRHLADAVLSGQPRIHYLRTLTDADALSKHLRPGARMVVIGGGYLGLEVAAVARRLGASVTVLEAMDRLLARVTSPTVSSFFQRLHGEEGVDVRLESSVVSVTRRDDTDACFVELESGDRLEADVVLASIGVDPEVSLAEDCGLDVSDGVVVDEFCRTSDSRIFAAGDCTNHPCFESGGQRRLQSLPNASEQALVVAHSIAGEPEAYTSTPWFWSEQYDVTLQSVGLPRATDEVVIRGTADAGRSFSAFYLREGQVRAADVVSSPRDFAVAKKLVGQRLRLGRTQLQDARTPLKELLRQPAS